MSTYSMRGKKLEEVAGCIMTICEYDDDDHHHHYHHHHHHHYRY